MNRETLARAEAIFKTALTLPPSERLKYLDQECGNNGNLRHLVDRLLANDEQGMEGFLEAPEAEPGGVFTQPSVEGKWIDRYQLVRRIGIGGMGQVFLARQQEPNREVALKILRADLSEAGLDRRFKQEIAVLGRLNHPGIAQIYDAGTTDDGSSYFVMEYVPGEPLDAFVRTRDLSPRARIDLAIQICEAVHYANEQGVIHRDLKPANILVTELGAQTFQVKVLDFGVARLNQEMRPEVSVYTQPGQVLGTIAYMSPEQAAGKTQDMDSRADVYQLGVILYELLAKRLPLDLDQAVIAFALRRIIEEDPPSLGSLDVSLKGDLEIIIAKALEKERDRRYTMPGDLADDLRHYLKGEAIVARPATGFYRLRKRLRKRRGLVMALAVITAVSVIAGWALLRDPKGPPPIPPQLTMLSTETKYTEGLTGPAISPDGTQVAVIEQPGHLKMMSIGGKNVEMLIEGVEREHITFSVAWHPSGDKLLLHQQVKDVGDILIWYDLASGATDTIPNEEPAYYPVISPDGKSAIVRRRQFNELAVMDLETGNIRPILECAPDLQIHTPVWGPGGRRIAYVVAGHATSYYLHCTDLDGNSTELMMEWLLETNYYQSSLFWLEDGRLLYALNRDISGTSCDLWALPMDPQSCRSAGEAQRVFSFPTWLIRDLSYSPVANRLAFNTRRTSRTVGLFEITSEGGLVKLDLPSTGWPGRPKSFVNDGRHLVIRETRDGNDTDAILQDVITGEFKPLLVGPEDASPQSTSPDGRYLYHFRGDKQLKHAEVWAYDLVEKSHIDLDYTIAVEDYYRRISNPIHGNGSNYLISQWGTDIIVREFSVAKGVLPEMLRLPIAVEDSPSQSLMSGDVSPDATRFAYLINYGEVFIRDFDTGATQSFPVGLGYAFGVQWSMDGNWLYIRGSGNPEAVYWIGRLELATGECELLWGSETEFPNEMFMSPDGRYLSCQLVEMGAAIGMLEEL